METKCSLAFRKFGDMQNWTEVHARKHQGTAVFKEKIHGTNLQWIIHQRDEKATCIHVGKRTAYLDDSDKFFNWQTVKKRLQPILEHTFEIICQAYSVSAVHGVVRLYGELYGGEYPGYPKSSMPVQRRIYYSPNLKWRCFTAEIENRLDNTFSHLGWKELVAIATETQLPLVPVFGEGKLSDFDGTVLRCHPISSGSGRRKFASVTAKLVRGSCHGIFEYG